MKKRIKTGLVVTLMTSAALLVGSQAFASYEYEFHVSETHPGWEESGHSDNTSEAFNHWNGDGNVSSSCARCHSSSGYMDYLGVGKVVNATTGLTVYEPTANNTTTWDNNNPDLTWVGANTAYSVEDDAQLGQVAECAVCHDYMDPSSHHPNAAGYPDLIFPSGANVTNPDKNASFSCMVCHQGRESGPAVDQMIADANASSGNNTYLDTADGNVTFLNVHYFAAGATLYGAEAQGGYQYDGKSYDQKFDHAAGIDACADCHDPHSLEIREAVCGNCHSQNDPRDYRMQGSVADYDGDGDTTEGIANEISDLGNELYRAIQAYAANVTEPIIYDSHSYPYWFVDSNNNGEVDSGESSYGNQYNYTNGWTPRLAKAAYNMQFALKDPGAFAHNPKYVIQLLYDSIEDLNATNDTVAAAIDMSGLNRGDGHHFDGASEAFRHWDEAGWNHAAGEVPDSCAKCHGEGLPDLLAGANVTATDAQGDGMACTNCHTGGGPDYWSYFTTRIDEETTFPADFQGSLNNNSNLCMECHAGRNAGDDVVAGEFTNKHYTAAGAALFGSDVGAGYHFLPDGNYSSQNVYRAYPGSLTTCTGCHMQEGDADHSFNPDLDRCNNCHVGGSFDALDHGVSEASANITTLETELKAAIQNYATANSMEADYLGHYPYWSDPDGNATLGIAPWDINMAGATYNLQFSETEPAAYIHNGSYMQQLLYDSIVALNGTPSVARPAPQAGTWTAPESEEGGFNSNIHTTHVNNQGITNCSACHDPTTHAPGAGGDGITGVVYKEASNSTKCNLWAVDESGDFYCADGDLSADVDTDQIQSCATVAGCHSPIDKKDRYTDVKVEAKFSTFQADTNSTNTYVEFDASGSNCASWNATTAKYDLQTCNYSWTFSSGGTITAGSATTPQVIVNFENGTKFSVDLEVSLGSNSSTVSDNITTPISNPYAGRSWN